MPSIVEEGFSVTRRLLLAAAGGVVTSACRTKPKSPTPTIQFTRVPLRDGSGTDKHDVIEGTVAGGREGQQIVLYAKNGTWWLQPLVDAPFTRILRNSNWRNATHLGTDYAALLVDPAYRPPANIQSLPPVGGPVAAVAVTKGATVSPSTTLQFSGYEWRVRTAASNRGGRSNPYSAGNAFTDERGALHLRIAKKGDRFECAEIAMTRSLGYGTYSFLVHDVSRLAQDVTFEMFTWDYSGTDQNNREMDVVIRRPAPTGKLSARFVVQPFHVSSNVHEFKVPGVTLRHSFRWEAGRIAFSTSRPDDPKHTIAEHTFTLGTPTPGVESARMALYLPNSASSHPAEAEVVVERFEYTP